jgi:glutamyl-tRNA synthetase
VQELREAGFLPAAVRNYLALLGWGTDDDATVLPTPELVERFSLERVGRSAAVFDQRKLRWLNGRYMRELPLGDYVDAVAGQLERDGHAEALADRDRLRRACVIAQDKAQTLSEVWPLIRFLFEAPVDDPKAWGKVMDPGAEANLAASLAALRAAEPFDVAVLERELGAVVERLGAKPKDVYQPIRVAITGTTVSPGIFDSLVALGREGSIGRIERALERLRSDAAGSGGASMGARD